MSYTAQGTSAARAVSGRFSLTADCKIGRMVDQSGRAFSFDRSPSSALEAVSSFDQRINGPQDRRMSDAELASNYWNLCPVGVLAAPSAPGESSRGGGGGSSQGGHRNPSGTTTVPSSPGPQITRPVPIVVPGGGGGGGGGSTPPPHNVGVPFPVAGVGLPAVLLAGGYVLLRRRSRLRPS
ncbi:MAG: hypothetical protein ABW003_13665 [Microvirga sp.]